MPKFLKITIFASLLAAMLLPQVVFAVDCSKGLVTCSRDCNNNGFIDPEERCNLCNVLQMLQKLLSTFPAALMVWAGIFVAIGGIAMLISGGAPDKVSQGKRIIGSTIFGLIIAFGAWIIINTVMNAIVDPVKMPWPWNKIECVPRRIAGGTHNACVNNTCKLVEGAGTNECSTDIDCTASYCACEVQVYATKYRDVPLFKEIKGTDLKTPENCKTNCVESNAKTYCPNRATADNYNLYCANQSMLKMIETVCAKTENIPLHSVACFANSNDCYAATLSNIEYTKKCYIDDQLNCGCTTGMATWCTSGKPIGLYQMAKEVGVGGLYNAWDCILNCGLSQGYCRIGSLTEEEEEPATTWRFQSGMEYQTEQTNDATTALTNFLNCFYQKASANIGYISAITDKDIYNGTCDPKKCKTSTCGAADCGADKLCDHACLSCHYGGTCTSAKSYAVDFGDEENVCAIATVARQCSGVNKIYGPQICEGKVETDGYHINHVHISVTNSCSCN